MTYSETLEYLYNKLPMFSRIGSDAIKKDLTNTLLICEALGNPQNKFKSIHIAGTNGKGSVSHMLAAILQTAGYKTGLYTSPHLYDFRERIKVDGIMVSEGFVIDFTERVKPLIEKIQPSFFEITVAMAFEYFAQQKVDVAVIETGLGGRLDSTNIITPQLSIITNISYDHMNILGNSLEEIAGEKAGIIKQKVPVVVGEYLEATKPVFDQKAKEKNATIYYAQNYLTDILHSLTPNYLQIIYERMDRLEVRIETDLQGIYQVNNVRTVLTALQILDKNNWKVLPIDILNGLKNVKKLTGLHGRWEVIQNNPPVVLEVAHNEDGIKRMLQHIALLDFNQLHIIFGVVKDKEFSKVLELLPKNASYYFTQAHIPRALPGNQLQEEAKKIGLEGAVYESVNLALDDALKKAAPDDLIIICGSIFLVAEVKRSSISMKL
jgi:dihydrofolate synthase / folylpolyglutamate synthase